VDVTHSYPEGQSRYIDGVKTSTNRRKGDFSGTISAFTYPESFYEDVLSQRRQQGFGLSYRVGNEIHLVYNILIQPASKTTQQLETEPFVWDFTTKAMLLGDRMTAHLIIDTGKAYSWTIAALEDLLYGSESADAHLPFPEEVLAIFDVNSILKVTDHGDGSFTLEGPDEAVIDNGDGTFEIIWPSVVIIDANEYRVSSL
jgi:hypothetical protein